MKIQVYGTLHTERTIVLNEKVLRLVYIPLVHIKTKSDTKTDFRKSCLKIKFVLTSLIKIKHRVTSMSEVASNSW